MGLIPLWIQMSRVGRGRKRQPVTRHISMAALVTVWMFVEVASAQASVAFIGTFQAWDVRVADTEDGRICAARALHPGLDQGEIFWAFNTALADSQPDGYLATDPRFLPTGGTIDVIVDDKIRVTLTPAEDGYAYATPAEDSALFPLMRAGLVMVVQVMPDGGPRQTIDVSLLGFTRATDAALAACSAP